jgi:glycosyltransferase involved in cell wall biosynthesis/MoaA/NifB/PqqE/SkfB family radical SAM enzyme
MRYNAGSEVYTQTLCHGLAERHEVHVFTREEDPFAEDYALRTETDTDDPRITLHLVNLPRSRDRYRHKGVDQCFGELLDELKPEVVHIGHLNHLSTSLIEEAANRNIPIVFTLHDYWLMCPRGQFMQMHPEDPANLWAACDGQEDEKCAHRCYARYFSGDPNEEGLDAAHWQGWVARRMKHVRDMCNLVDTFIAPAKYLQNRFIEDFGLPEEKLVYLDYGFDLDRLKGRKRDTGEPFTFGYIGTHIPAKGIHHLLEAFGNVKGESRLRIWGRHRGQETEALRQLSAKLPRHAGERVEWLNEYRNQDIIKDVFKRVDAIVVPSVWAENSPLVIHEALQARVPVITADTGGMAEYVKHEENGLLFSHRNPDSLASMMQKLADNPVWAQKLGALGYLPSVSKDIPDIGSHVKEVEKLYELARARKSTHIPSPVKGPWRITFDTNPDTCNLGCIMCEEHSPYRLNGKRKEPRLMEFATIKKVVEEAVQSGLQEIIPSTMGEPLLYPHFDEMAELCHEYNLKLNLTTNGTFPGRGSKAWAELVVPIASDVKISWNGATAKTQEAIMPGSKWDERLRDLRTFIETRDQHASKGGNRCSITLQLTFMEINVNELADIVDLAIDLGIDRVKGHHLWVHYPETEALSMRRSSDSIRRWNNALASALEAAKRLLPNGQKIRLDNFFPLDESATQDLAPDGSCPFLGKEAWINTGGRFDPCCAPDDLRRALGDFGKVSQHGLMRIWESPGYQSLLTGYQKRELCISCNMRSPKGAT